MLFIASGDAHRGSCGSVVSLHASEVKQSMAHTRLWKPWSSWKGCKCEMVRWQKTWEWIRQLEERGLSHDGHLVNMGGGGPSFSYYYNCCSLEMLISRNVLADLNLKVHEIPSRQAGHGRS